MSELNDAQNQQALDHYNRHYNNRTYRAFTDKLNEIIAMNPGYSFEFGDAVLNSLIDSALERCGAALYEGAEQRLNQLICHLSQDLVLLAQAHLLNFGPLPKLAGLTQNDFARDTFRRAQHLAEEGTRMAGDICSWRGRLAFKFSSAAAYLLHAADAVLVDSHYDNYPLEKLDRALSELRDGVVDSQRHGFGLSPEFMAWIRQLVKARY